MNNKIDAEFVNFLETMVNLNALDRMTTNLGNDLTDSQAVMNEIKEMIDAMPAKTANVTSEPDSNGLRHEDVSEYLTAGTPELLMPDMDINLDVHLEDVISSMKSYVEDLKKNFTQTQPETQERIPTMQLESLELEEYATNLDKLCKRLTNVKLNMKTEANSLSVELETKLAILCENVNMFTKVVKAQTSLSEANKFWSPTQQNTNVLGYENLVNRLLADINSVSYLLISKK